MLIAYLKKKFGSQNIRKLYYFSSGAGFKYKNKLNFVNLVSHEKDFGILAEWHFFTTAHEKGSCNSIGGSLRNQAYHANLRSKDNATQIISTEKLFELAQTFFPKISFIVCN